MAPPPCARPQRKPDTPLLGPGLAAGATATLMAPGPPSSPSAPASRPAFLSCLVNFQASGQRCGCCQAWTQSSRTCPPLRGVTHSGGVEETQAGSHREPSPTLSGSRWRIFPAGPTLTAAPPVPARPSQAGEAKLCGRSRTSHEGCGEGRTADPEQQTPGTRAQAVTRPHRVPGPRVRRTRSWHQSKLPATFPARSSL